MNILDEIFVAKRADILARKTKQALADAKARALDAPPTRGFQRALKTSPHPVSLIAEVKKGSPVKGTIRDDFDPEAIARDYAFAGADCLSVLTDVHFFQGSPDYLAQCREISNKPVIRKDFTTDELDVYEARAMGADAILLIVNGLSRSELTELRELAESLSLDVLVESHTLEEAEIALEAGAKLLGVNNRDLETFEINIEASEHILPLVKDRATCVSESALHNRNDVERVQAAGARSVLIGTAFSQSPDIPAKIREMMGW
ncbi:MAG: indole-3-glycerol phosphate synthase TrpC [Armatimonadetes bacterium]|nr:indole-3-glycerol phosphate synthase TrpC [Armatimonadota bacterium]